MGISSLGIGSGLKSAELLDGLKENEQKRLIPFTTLQKSYKAKLSIWGSISSSLDTLNKSVKSLQRDTFNTMSVSSNKAFTAKATAGASADTHSITVNQLASSHKLRSDPVKSADDAQGSKTENNSRTVIITQKDGSEMKVKLKDDETSLNQIAKAINKENGNVTASVQRTDQGEQLVFSAKKTGSDGEMSIRVEGDDKLNDFLHVEKGGKHVDKDGNPVGEDAGAKDRMTSVSDAKDAKLRVDGSDYTRSTNNIDDILTGITLELKEVSKETETLTLTQDVSEYKTGIKKFVEDYNALLKQTNAASKYVPNDSANTDKDGVARPNPESGALVGDSMLRDMVNQIRSTVNGIYGDSSAEYNSLADIGIKIDSATGLMTLDESKLDAAIAASPGDIANIFMDKNGNQGLASTLNDIIVSFTGDSEKKIDGSIKQATDNLDEQVKEVNAQIEKTQKLIDEQVERYRKQFQNLDKVMTELDGIANKMNAMLNALK